MRVVFYLNIDLLVLIGSFGVVVGFIDFLCVVNGGWLVGLVLILLIFEGGCLCVWFVVVIVEYDEVVDWYNWVIIEVIKDIVDNVVCVCLFVM